jgi:hypothetical protein
VSLAQEFSGRYAKRRAGPALERGDGGGDAEQKKKRRSGPSSRRVPILTCSQCINHPQVLTARTGSDARAAVSRHRREHRPRQDRPARWSPVLYANRLTALAAAIHAHTHASLDVPHARTSAGVITGDEEKSKSELETLIHEYGGHKVQYPGAQTFCAIAGRESARHLTPAAALLALSETLTHSHAHVCARLFL